MRRAPPLAESSCLPPFARRSARVLILGSLPGQLSLARQQYYAHPHNVFWRLMGDLFDAGPELPYRERIDRLTTAGVALWDVCASGVRPGSLDSSIAASSVVPNRITEFLVAHPEIRLIGLNGAKAAQLYERHIVKRWPADLREIPYERLPSTSPAHAGMTYAEKLRRWSVLLEP
jgi:hypoxanthine-DNA glycosylase